MLLKKAQKYHNAAVIQVDSYFASAARLTRGMYGLVRRNDFDRAAEFIAGKRTQAAIERHETDAR